MALQIRVSGADWAERDAKRTGLMADSENKEIDFDHDGGLFPVLPLRDIVVFPHMIVPLFVGREKSITALEEVMEHDKQILLVTQKDAAQDDPDPTGMYDIGTLATVLQLLEMAQRHAEITAKVADTRNSNIKLRDANVKLKERLENLAEIERKTNEIHRVSLALQAEISQQKKVFARMKTMVMQAELQVQTLNERMTMKTTMMTTYTIRKNYSGMN